MKIWLDINAKLHEKASQKIEVGYLVDNMLMAKCEWSDTDLRSLLLYEIEKWLWVSRIHLLIMMMCF